MAEGASVRKDDVVCRFFLTSSCRDGEKCLFSHDKNRRIPDSVCRYYLKDVCMFGKNCRYDHVKVKKEGKFKSRHSNNGLSRRSDGDITVDMARSNTIGEGSRQPINCPVMHGLSKTSEYGPNSANWINAPEFVPRSNRSYADTVRANTVQPENVPPAEFCPLFMVGDCPFGEHCLYVHGDICALCNTASLHPFDENQRKSHTEECEKEIELDMELSFAVQESMDKTCGICMDVILKKEPLSERQFGILQKCNHVFCLSCIRKWRALNQNQRLGMDEDEQRAIDLAPSVTRSCPECRKKSDFVIPSSYFVDSEEGKIKLITEYKKTLSTRRCKYFKRGEGTCPFGGSCFYLHDKPDGTKVELPPLTRRRRQNQDGDIETIDHVFLWDFLLNRDEDRDYYGLYDSDEDDDVGNDDVDTNHSNNILFDLVSQINLE